MMKEVMIRSSMLLEEARRKCVADGKVAREIVERSSRPYEVMRRRSTADVAGSIL